MTPINNRALGGTGFEVRATGAGVTSYIVDSGIEFSDPDFGGRAVPGYDAIGDGLDGGDCNGHGTHVAGVVGGSYTGVARKTALVSVRVFPCDGRTANSAVIAGIDWVAGHAKKPAVANLSLAGRWSLAANRAVEGLAVAGVFPVAAAGNDDLNACFVSPASSRGAYGRGDRPGGPSRLVQQLGNLRRHPRTGHGHPVGVPQRELPRHGRHLDGRPARHRDRRPVQGLPR